MKKTILILFFLLNFTFSFCQKNNSELNSTKNKPYTYSNTVKYLTLLDNNSIECVSFRENPNFRHNVEINSSVLYNNELYVGGYFNRINGLHCYNLIKIRNDSIFAIFVGKNKNDGSISGSYEIGIINKLCVFEGNIYAATSNGLWSLVDNKWIRIGTGLKGYIDSGFVSINIEENQIGACLPEVKDMAVYDEKLYLVFDCSAPIGSCFFKRKLIVLSDNKFKVISDSLNILNKNISSLNLISNNNGLYFSADSSIAKIDNQSVKLISDNIPPLKLLIWKEHVFGAVLSPEGYIKVNQLYKIESDSIEEYLIEGLPELDLKVIKLAVWDDELFLSSCYLWKSEIDNSEYTFLYSIMDSKIRRTDYKNGFHADIIFYNNKPLSIFFNIMKCIGLENKLNVNNGRQKVNSAIGSSINNRVELHQKNEPAPINVFSKIIICPDCNGSGRQIGCKESSSFYNKCVKGMKHCRSCDGKKFDRQGRVCIECRGIGLVYCENCKGNPKSVSQICKTCEGHRKIRYNTRTCAVCNGSGKTSDSHYGQGVCFFCGGIGKTRVAVPN